MPYTVRPTLQQTPRQLAQVRPSNASATSAYSPASDDIEAEITSIFVCNQSGSAATFRIFHDDNGSSFTAAEALFWDVSVAGNTTTEINDAGIFMINSAGNIGVRSDTGSALTFTLYGTETQIRSR